MEGDGLVQFSRKAQPSGVDHFGDVLSVVLGFEADLTVPVLEGVEAVGRGGHHPSDLAALEQLQVVLDEELEQPLLPHPVDGVSAAALVVPQGPEARPGRLEGPHQRPRHLLAPGVVGRGAAHVVEEVHLRGVGLNVQPLGPLGPLDPGPVPGIPMFEHALQGVPDGGGDLPLLDGDPPYAQYHVEGGELLGAAVLAGGASGATPEGALRRYVHPPGELDLPHQPPDVEPLGGDGAATCADSALDAL